MNMETLTEHVGLKGCVLSTELPHFAVSVVGSAVEVHDISSDTGPARVTYVTADRDASDSLAHGCHAVAMNSEGISTLVSTQVSQEQDVFQSEDLGHHPVPGDQSLLTSDSEAITLTAGPQVIQQLHTQNGLENRGPDNVTDDHEVILVYQDIFTCGACSKQFVDLTEFLEHKTHHTIGSMFHKCDLCQMVFRSQELITDHYQKAHQVSFYDTDKDVDTTHPDDTDLNMANPSSIEDLGMNGKAGLSMVESVAMDNLQSVTKVMGEDGLSIGMVNGDMCTSEQCTEEDDRGTSEHPGVFVHTGLQDTQGNLHVSGVEESPNEGGVTIKVLSPNDAASAGISLSDPDDGLMERLHTNGIMSIVNGNHAVSGTLSPKKPQVSERMAVPDAESKPDFNFILQTEMVKGSTFTYGKTWFKCLHCAFKTSTKLMIAKHMQEDHVNLIDPHQGLELKDITGSDKRKIMKMSTYESIFGRESRFRRCTKKGKRPEKQDVPGVYTCGTCGKVFTRTRYLRKHHETHKTEKKYLCDECGKSFKSRTYLQVHRRIHKEKLFRCNQCDFKSKINAAIHAHRQVHSQGSVLCDICGYAYTDKSTLNKHKRVHDLNRPYKCNFPGCTWRFKTEVMCKAHIRAHTTEGKFKCSFCGYLFRHKHHLQRHETSMHGVKHTKTRTNHMAGRKKDLDMDDDDDEQDMNLVINAVEDALPLPEETQHLVVATDNQGTPIAFEGTDLSALNVAYQTLFQSQDGNNARTLVMTQPDTQVIFKPTY